MLSVAAVDVGSNAIRLAVVKIGSTGTTTQSYSHRYPVRLGADVFGSGKIGPARQKALLQVFTDIARRVKRFDVQHYRVVATSAMRDATNSEAVIELIRQKTGLGIDVISGHEEGRLTRLTLMRSLGSVPSDSLLVDLGGGSLELEHTTGLGGRSLPFGTVRMIHKYPALGARLDAERLDAVSEQIKRDLEKRLKNPTPAEVAIGTGGNLDALARLIPAKACAVPAIDVTRLKSFLYQLAKLTPNERAQRFKLRKDRADVIVPAAIIIQSLTELFHLRVFAVPGTGIRESVLQSLVNQAEVVTHASDVVRHWGQDLAQLERRARVARRLFELLSPLHGLWTPALAALEAAAYFQDLGALIDPNKAVKHTHYLLEHAAGLELDARSRKVAALVATMATGHRDISGRRVLLGSDRDVAALLGAILRLADALTTHSDAFEPRVNLLNDPIVVEVGLTKRLAPEVVSPLERLLHRRIKIR